MPLNHNLLFTIALMGFGLSAGADPIMDESFQRGTEAYRAAEFATSAEWFGECAARQPSSGAWQNLGLAEWRSGHVGEAIVAWERAVWLDPANRSASANLQFARKTAQLESPTLAWNEVPSTWLSVNTWAWLGGVSLWAAVGLIMLPTFLRRPRASWSQALAATGLAIFLLSLPAQIGGHTRARIGFVVGPGAALRLSPTRDAETVTQLAPGEPARGGEVRGDYVFVRTSRNSGWLERVQFEFVCPR
jgi:tetratricopeptide (TPR) repeat protein